MAQANSHAIKVVERRTFLELDIHEPVEFCGNRNRTCSDSMVDYGCNPFAIVDDKWDNASNTTTASCCNSDSSKADSESECDSAVGYKLNWASDTEDELEFAIAMVPRKADPPNRVASSQQPSQRGPWSNAIGKSSNDLPMEQWTTLVLKQLPENCSQVDLCQLVESLDFAGLYNFMYAPVNFKTHAIFGYCFVNFVNHETASEAMRRLEDFAWPDFGFARIELQWSQPHQGIEAQIERYRNSPVMHKSVPQIYKPLLLQGGQRIAFPKPTILIRAPRNWVKQKGHKMGKLQTPGHA